MGTSIFVHLPVADLDRSMAFFHELGWTFDRRYTDGHVACLAIGDNVYAMLLPRPLFRTLTDRPVADPAAATGTILALALDSRERVDALADTALARGGGPVCPPIEEGSMYSRSFRDPDGHQWAVFCVTPKA
jgi:predicted lactoylglutathione lyase